MVHSANRTSGRLAMSILKFSAIAITIYFGYSSSSAIFHSAHLPRTNRPAANDDCSRFEITGPAYRKESGGRFIVRHPDIFIAVRSTKNHVTRLKVIRNTWYPFIEQSTVIFTDGSRSSLDEFFGDGIIETNCSPEHSRSGLSCKLHREMVYFVSRRNATWFCHLDDDVYLNVPKFLEMLKCFNPRYEWYIGRNGFNRSHRIRLINGVEFKVYYSFPIGSTYCFTRPVVKRLLAIIGSRKMYEVDSNLNDDVMIGYLTEFVLGLHKTEIGVMYNQYMKEGSLQLGDLKRLVTFASGLINLTVPREKRFEVAHDYLINNDKDYVSFREKTT